MPIDVSRTIILVTLSSLLSIQVSTADDDPDPLRTIVVTASRNPIPQSRTGSSVTVIDTNDISARQSHFVADLLRQVPGLSVSQNGNLGGLTQVRMRGAEGNHTLVLIDGVEANDPVSGAEFDFGQLLTTNVDRIEVLRGAQSALYGADAIGGVVNIITRSAETPALNINFARGNIGNRSLGGTFAGGNERLRVSVGADYIDTDGTNIARSGSETDGSDNLTLSAKVDWIASDSMRLGLNVRQVDANVDFDEQDFAFPSTPTQGLIIDGNGARSAQHWYAGLRLLAGAAQAAWQHRLNVDLTSTDNEFTDSGIFTSGSTGERLKFAYQTQWQFAQQHDLTLAVERELLDYRNRGPAPTSLETQAQRDNQNSAIVEYRGNWSEVDISVSARHDVNQRFADATTYRVTASRRLGDRRRLRASFGTGISNPTFFELYGFFPSSFVGNPAIQPEQSQSFDIGFEQQLLDNRLTLNLTYFQADLENEIQTVFDFNTFLASAVNLTGTSRRDGLEAALYARPFENWHFNAAYTYTDSKQDDGRVEVRRPRHVASFNNTFDFAQGRGMVHVGIDFNGAQQDNEFIFATPADRAELSSFTRVNTAVRYAVNNRVTLTGRVDNLLNEDYEELFSFVAPGRVWWLGINLNLGGNP